MKMKFELVSADTFLRYKVMSNDTICGFLDLTQEESDALRFVLNEGVKSFQDHEFEIEYEYTNPSLKVYAEVEN